MTHSRNCESVEVLRVREGQHTARPRAHVCAGLLLLAILGFAPGALAAGGANRYAKLDDELNQRATSGRSETTSVIAHFKGSVIPKEFEKYARPGKLDLIDAYVLDVPDDTLKTLGAHSSTVFVNHNNTAVASNFRTGIQSGAFFARQLLGFTGAGIGVAVVDSGIAPVDDFGVGRGAAQERGASRIAYFRDFLVPDSHHDGSNGTTVDPPCATPLTPCDFNGHGTHVAGTIAGNGHDSFGERAGMAPRASIYALRVLGKDGTGSLAGVLEALQWVLDNARSNNIRVVNLSFGMAPKGVLNESVPSLLDQNTGDPLALATKKLVDAGIFVVAADGNIGQVDCAKLTHPHNPSADGKCEAWGGVTAPGTYPWVFTAGANRSEGTFTRGDDTRAKFSSRGPAFPLQNAKPDILAGGVGIESTSAPGSTLYTEALGLDPLPLLAGSSTSEPFPYMALSGTSQAAAVVSGVAAQMLQANPRLTPNLIKAILEYTSQVYYQGSKGYSPLEQGAGFLNALGAVRLSRFYATAEEGQRVPVEPIWSRHFIWGNHQLSGGLMLPEANAWQLGVQWGVAKTDDGENIVWGTSCGLADCGENIVWGTSGDENIVWGTADSENIVWGTEDVDGNIVWGTDAGDENIVWGTDCGGADCENIVWGTDDGNIVWGTAEGDENIVWGTDGDGNIVWGTDDEGNIVWGTDDFAENIVWGTGDLLENIVWGTDDLGNIVWGTGRFLNNAIMTQDDWYHLFLNRRFALSWVRREFGDRFITRGGQENESRDSTDEPRVR